ncbi:MAG: hypothetical protein HFG89_12945 [Dorea sp.]|nr:hypothetical protein [Dorea sp.]
MRSITVEILGVKLEAALLNYKVAKKYDDGIKKVVRIADESRACGSGPEAIEKQCNAVIGFIDDIFGHDSAKRVLGEETDLLTCQDAWEELTDVYEKQVNPILEERNEKVKFKEKNGDV